MRLYAVAAFALTIATSLAAQSGPDLSIAPAQPGNWTYSPAADGSESVFTDANSVPQLWLHCTRSNRSVTVSRATTAAAPTLNVWTSTTVQNIPATFDAATSRLSFRKPAYDPLLDAMAYSRGRIGVAIGTSTPLVVPPWEEVARVIEDCRA
jgi:hypothetical protein